MTPIDVREKPFVEGEEEGLEILMNIQSDLNYKEQVIFFFFFVKNSILFQDSKDEFHLRTLITINNLTFEKLINMDISSGVNYTLVRDKILEIWRDYIKDNTGTCANYFGIINLYLIKEFLSGSYDDVKREAKIMAKNVPINKNHIDIVARSNIICDLFECKHSIFPHRKKLEEKQIPYLNGIVEELIEINYQSRRCLATIEFVKKDKACSYVPNLCTLDIINGEDVFGVPMKS